MDKRFKTLAKTGSRIEHERALAEDCLMLVNRILKRQGNDSTYHTFLEHEAMACVLYSMNLLLAKDGGEEQVLKEYEAVINAQAHKAEGQQW